MKTVMFSSGNADMLDIACCRTARAVVVAADFCHPLTLFVISNLPTYIDMQKGHMP